MRSLIIIFCCQLLIVCNSNGQGKFSAFYSTKIKEATGDEDLKDSNKSLYIIFNSSCCLLSINNVTAIFKTINYKNENISVDTSIQISFSSGETKELPENWYNITLKKSKDNSISISINNPNSQGGRYYYVDQAMLINESDNSIANNLIVRWERFNERLQNENLRVATPQYLEDKSKKDSMIAQYLDSLYSLGDNYSLQQINWIVDLVASKVKIERGEQFFKDYKIFIDAEGYITKVVPVEKNDPLAEKYLGQISEVVTKLKMAPFQASNGKFYPSYKTMFFTLTSE